MKDKGAIVIMIAVKVVIGFSVTFTLLLEVAMEIE